jgi:enoyl-CoA hydratase/carnithine racemase
VSAELVLVERRATLSLLTLNRPEARNPLDRDSAAALLTALTGAFEDDEVRSVAITGAGSAFCAGGDLSQLGGLRARSIDDVYRWPESIVALHRLMLHAPKPVVAAVNGAAFAGGMGLAGMCDVILATESARFAMPEVKIGLFPMIIVPTLARALPRKRLLEMMMTGDPMDAAEAKTLGFVSQIYADGVELLGGVDDYGRRFAAVSPQALRLGRQAFTLLADLPAEQALDAAQFLNLPFFLGDDLQEGVKAFFDKRAPDWKDHRDG